MKVSKKKPAVKKAKLEDLAPKADPKGGFTGGVFVAAGDVNGDNVINGGTLAVPAVQNVTLKISGR